MFMTAHSRGRPIATYCDIINIIHQLRNGLHRETIREQLQKDFAVSGFDSDSSNSGYEDDDDVWDDLVDLAVRLWVMIPVGGFRQISNPGTSLEWISWSLQETLRQRFQKQVSLKESVKLEKMFNATGLERIGGLRIIWTSNLLDHLRMQDDDTRVSIFHHASFLHLHRDTNVFPAGFVEETLQTLALLLPRHDKRVKKWYTRQSRLFKLDPSAAKGGPLNTQNRQIEKFEYWHDRLVILKEVFDDAEPGTILQWWEDRRKRVQWYTFWVAALVLGLTVFFGILQSVEGFLQVWKAYHPS